MLNAKNGPISVYYCKAGIKTGRTCRVEQFGEIDAGFWECEGVRLRGAVAEMFHDNAVGKAKRSGARCVLLVTNGEVELVGDTKRIYKKAGA